MGAIASQITSLTIVYSAVYSDADQRKHESSASLAFVWGIHREPVNSPHKWPVTWKMSLFGDVIMVGYGTDVLWDYIVNWLPLSWRKSIGFSELAIIRTNTGLSLMGPMGTDLNEIRIANFMQINSFENAVCKMVSILYSKWTCVTLSLFVLWALSVPRFAPSMP